MQPLSDKDKQLYTEIYYKYVKSDLNNLDLAKNNLVMTMLTEAMMNETPFKLHDDPEEVTKQEIMLDKNNSGYFNLESWLHHMMFKQNYVSEDLIKSFRVFDIDHTGQVSKDELKVTFMNLMGSEVGDERNLMAMFAEAMPFTDESGNIDYERLTKVMLEEPDPLALPEHI